MNEFSQNVIDIIKQIPYGKVISYGSISKLAGHPRGARQVGWLLNQFSEKENLPWHRVINSKGEISLTDDGFSIQKELLEKEGVTFKSDKKIDINQHTWDTTEIELEQFFK